MKNLFEGLTLVKNNTKFNFLVGDNIFHSRDEYIVNPVNTVGVMGKGLALAFKEKFPKNFKKYKEACLNGELKVGNLFIFSEKEKTVVNFPTKEHYKDRSKLEYIEYGLIALKYEIKRREIKSISIPKLGCGLGGLRWTDVQELIKKHLGQIEGLEVNLYI